MDYCNVSASFQFSKYFWFDVFIFSEMKLNYG